MRSSCCVQYTCHQNHEFFLVKQRLFSPYRYGIENISVGMLVNVFFEASTTETLVRNAISVGSVRRLLLLTTRYWRDVSFPIVVGSSSSLFECKSGQRQFQWNGLLFDCWRCGEASKISYCVRKCCQGIHNQRYDNEYERNNAFVSLNQLGERR